jgi:hypothetical protein
MSRLSLNSSNMAAGGCISASSSDIADMKQGLVVDVGLCQYDDGLACLCVIR